MYGKVIAEPVSSSSANQPANPYPSLVGAVGADITRVDVVTVVAMTLDPPFESKLMFRVFASHFAWSVKSAVRP